MSDDIQYIDVITGTPRRRRWTGDQRIQIDELSFEPRETVSLLARGNGVSPDLLYSWRRLMREGSIAAVGSDDGVVGSSELRKLEARVRELERLLGRNTMDVEILREALAKFQAKKTDLAAAVAIGGGFAMTRIAETLGVSQSNLYERIAGRGKPRGSYFKADDEALPPPICQFVDARPTYGCRQTTVLVNRELARQGLPPASHKCVYRIMKRWALLLQRNTGRVHDGTVVVMRSNLRWCSVALEFTSWNGDIIRIAFIIDAHDREASAWQAVCGADISGDMVRDMMLEGAEKRFAASRAPHPVEHLSGNASAYTAKLTRDFALALNLVSSSTPVHSPESNGLSETFVKTFKRDYLRVNPMPDGATALRQILGWVEDYNESHPHSVLRMRTLNEFIRAQAQCPTVR